MSKLRRSHYAVSDLGLHCLHRSPKKDAWHMLIYVNIKMRGLNFNISYPKHGSMV